MVAVFLGPLVLSIGVSPSAGTEDSLVSGLPKMAVEYGSLLGFDDERGRQTWSLYLVGEFVSTIDDMQSDSGTVETSAVLSAACAYVVAVTGCDDSASFAEDAAVDFDFLALDCVFLALDSGRLDQSATGSGSFLARRLLGRG